MESGSIWSNLVAAIVIVLVLLLLLVVLLRMMMLFGARTLTPMSGVLQRLKRLGRREL